jgi:uncharacterized phage protein gp47/JayE
MGRQADGSWRADPIGVHLATIRQEWDAELGPGDYDGTPEGALSYGAAVLARRVEEGAQIVADMLDPRTAVGDVLDGFAAQVGIRRRPATASTYVVRSTVPNGFTHVLRAGSVLAGGGADGQATWTVDADTTITPSDTLVEVTCQQTGPVVLSGVTSLRTVTPQAVAVTTAWDPGDGDPYSVGRVRESNGLLRVRLSRSQAAVPSPTRDGIRAGMLAVPWVVAASVVRVSAGVIRCTVYPAPATAAQEQELVDAIGFRAVSLTDSASSDGSGTYTLSDGSTETIWWTEGGDQAVTVAVALTLLPGWVLADVSPAVQAAVEAVFASLDVGEGIAYMTVYCAVASAEGIASFTLALNGGAANVSAVSSTDFLVPTTTIT